MSLQNSIIKKYMRLSSSPTYREVADDTGIQMTRVFRIMNGAPMKLAEYEIFEEKVRELSGVSSSFVDLSQKCFEKLSVDIIRDIESYMQRKLTIGERYNVAMA